MDEEAREPAEQSGDRPGDGDALVFAELLGTFFLVLVALGAGMVNARFGGRAPVIAAFPTGV